MYTQTAPLAGAVLFFPASPNLHYVIPDYVPR